MCRYSSEEASLEAILGVPDPQVSLSLALSLLLHPPSLSQHGGLLANWTVF